MSGFSNAVIGGAEKLVRRAIQSPNFQTLISGWSIDKDGTAEFNDVTIRGTGGASEILIGPPAPEPQVDLFVGPNPDSPTHDAGQIAFRLHSTKQTVDPVIFADLPNQATAAESGSLIFHGPQAGAQNDSGVIMSLQCPGADGSDTAQFVLAIFKKVGLPYNPVNIGEGVFQLAPDHSGIAGTIDLGSDPLHATHVHGHMTLDRYLGFPTYTDATLPAIGTVPVGATVYNTTHSFLVSSNGAHWCDQTGAIVV